MIVIEDDGVGFTYEKNGREGHFGFVGMKERALMIGADLQIVSAPADGTRVILEVDL